MPFFAAWPHTAHDYPKLAQTKLAMPVLSIAVEKAGGEVLAAQMKLVALNVNAIVLEDTGHCVTEGRSRETMQAILNFL